MQTWSTESSLPTILLSRCILWKRLNTCRCARARPATIVRCGRVLTVNRDVKHPRISLMPRFDKQKLNHVHPLALNVKLVCQIIAIPVDKKSVDQKSTCELKRSIIVFSNDIIGVPVLCINKQACRRHEHRKSSS